MALNINLHPKQSLAFQSPATEILYGGSAGGGKSHAMRIFSIVWCSEIPNLQVYLFRRQSVDLEKNHMEGPTGFRSLLAEWVSSGHVTIVEGQVRFWNGSKIYLCHCKDENDRFNYQGAEIHVLLIDELTHFTEIIYRFLRSRVRASESLVLPDKYKSVFPRILCGSNPGGVGHGWVKRTFIDGRVPMELVKVSDDEGGFLRQFIPARLTDNPSLNEAEYSRALSGLGSPALVKAMRDGDWTVVAGSYFPEFCGDHVLEPFKLPSSWTKFFGFDWGSASPFACLWAAVSDGTYGPPDYEPHELPRDSVIFYREWYGGGDDDKGISITNEEIASGIMRREGIYERVAYRVADPSIFKFDGGPSIAEQFLRKGISFTKADNNRIAGWQQIRSRLLGINEHPLIYFFNTCVHSIRTIPELQYDVKRLEDLNTDSADHLADVVRYMCMSRPWSKDGKKKEELRTLSSMTYDEVWKMHDDKFKRDVW